MLLTVGKQIQKAKDTSEKSGTQKGKEARSKLLIIITIFKNCGNKLIVIIQPLKVYK